MAIAPFRRQPPVTTAEWERFLREANVTAQDITNDKIRDSNGLSVIGRSQSTAGQPSDIVASTDGEFLRVRENLLTFGVIVEDEIPAEIKRKYTAVNIATDGELAANSVNLITAYSPINVSLPAGASGDQISIKKINWEYDVLITGGLDGHASVKMRHSIQSINAYYSGSGWIILSHSAPIYPVAKAALEIQQAEMSGIATKATNSSGSMTISSPVISGAATSV